MSTRNLVSTPRLTTPYMIERHTRSRQDLTEGMAAQLQHKENLLREVQHRVGNSLQLIASILAMDARKVHSKRARVHLESAHRRILAVATMQQQLDTSRESGDCELSDFLHRLCENLKASVVGDTTRIAIAVEADTGTVSPAFAINIGLIVTELAINALKHAFMAETATGKIVVTYRSQGANWRLTVSDDVIGGRCGEREATPAGLGTSIVANLVRQLDGRKEISTGLRGRSVSITHGVFSESWCADAKPRPRREPDSHRLSVYRHYGG